MMTIAQIMEKMIAFSEGNIHDITHLSMLRILSDNEFFVEERTISNTLVEQDDFYNELLRSKASTRKLKAMFPGFDWN